MVILTKLRYREELKYSSKSRRGATRVPRIIIRTIMKMSSFEMGKHGLHNDDKGFCIIILDVTKYTLNCFDVEM